MTDAEKDLILKELDRLLASPEFDASERNRRFLRHVVEETLAGRGARIKAYSIATGAFGRGDDFDPQQDSIVRIEAARLRRALEHFYLKQIETSRVWITIPKGAYVPEFIFTAARPPPDPVIQSRPRTALHRATPRVLVENFELQGPSELLPRIERVLTRQVIATLTPFTELFVYGFDTTDLLSTENRYPRGREQLTINYRLFGTISISAEALQLELLLQDAEDSRFVWAQTFERDLEIPTDSLRIVGLCKEIAGNVARVLALRDGILDSQARETANDAPQNLSGYQKLLDFQDYWRTLDPDLYQPLRLDLEATVAEDPRFASAFACLSLLYSDAARYRYDVSDTCVEPLDRAMDLAQRAIHIKPNSSCAYRARAVAEWFSGRPENSLATLRTARMLNPNDPEVLAELGFRCAMRMNWETALPLIKDAYERNPRQSGQYRMGLFLYHFAKGEFELALQETAAINTPGIAYVHLAAAAALSRLDRTDEARARLEKASRLAPALLMRLAQDLAFRQLHPDLSDPILAALDDIDPGATRRFGIRDRFGF
jgi:TolB-like protein